MFSDRQSSLALLADVALESPSAGNYICRKRRKPRSVLKITTLNGVDHAEVTDLKCLPISTLFKIFVEKFEDKKSHNLGYVCKYGLCNNRFTGVDGNRTNRLEHLLQCHLLEHLMKTKSGSMIKLPRVPLECNAATQSSGNAIHLVEIRGNELRYHPAPIDFETANDETTAVIEPKIDCTNEVSVGTKSSEPAVNIEPIGGTVEMELNRPAVNVEWTGESVEVELNIPTVNIEAVETLVCNKNKSEDLKMEDSLRGLESDLRKITFDHSYSALSKIPSQIPVTSPRRALTKIEFIRVDVNNLYCLNSESSSELNNFMLEETLKRQVSLAVIDGGDLIVGQLPLVGSEIEVTTDAGLETQPIVTAEKLAMTNIYCTDCEETFSSKKVLSVHIKEKHSNPPNGKPSNQAIRVRQGPEEMKTIKRKRQPSASGGNSDLEVIKENKYNSVDNFVKRCDASILKTALLKDSNSKKPVINISNLWNSINVQYI